MERRRNRRNDPRPAGGAGPISDDVEASEKDHLLAAQRVSRTGSWVWDLSSGDLSWSEELYRILGTSRGEIGPGPEAIFANASPQDQERGVAVLQAARRDGSGELEYLIALADGRDRWVELRAEALVDRAGQPVRLLGTVQDVTERRVRQDALLEQERAEIEAVLAGRALYDPVTGLPNRTLLVNRAGAALDRAERRGWSIAILIVDIDRFREVNDEFGHDVGDELLALVGERLTSAVRSYDTVARSDATVSRFASDEFVIVCEDVADVATARRLGRRIHEALHAPIQVSAGEVAVTASVGITTAAGTSGQFDTLMLEAESAMRRAKRRGRGGVEVFVAGMRSTASRESHRELRAALESGQFSLAYQPKIVLATDQIAGVEALLRWEHPDRGNVPPLEFIPSAEESGLIIPIGRWVVEEACHQAARWRAQFPSRPALVTSVNVSARQFGPDLVQLVGDAVAGAGIPPETLCLEVTESILMDDIDRAIATLRSLADIGIALSIDDFGTGYSSLAYLKQFPLDELKVDKSFVDGLGQDPNDTAIVAAVVAMAHALKLSVVAEGVETADQVERLRTLGCEQAQGYHFARPTSAAAVDVLLADEAAASWRDHGSEEGGARSGEPYRADRVLVVDDSAEVRQLARMTLSAVGFEVSEAADGPAAMATARAAPPDCVLLDLVMPGMSGLDVCRALRADPATSETTILMLTANAEAADKVEAFSFGADDYIVKPFSPRDLTGRVRSAIRRRRESAPSQGP